MSDVVIPAIDRAVRRDPDNTDLRLHLVSLLMAAGRASEALRHCDLALRLEPDNTAARELAASFKPPSMVTSDEPRIRNS